MIIWQSIKEHKALAAALAGPIAISLLSLFIPADVAGKEAIISAINASFAAYCVYWQQKIDTGGSRKDLLETLVEDARYNQTICEQIKNASLDCQNKLKSQVGPDRLIAEDTNLQMIYNAGTSLILRCSLRKYQLQPLQSSLLETLERCAVKAATDKIRVLEDTLTHEKVDYYSKQSPKSVIYSFLGSLIAACEEAENALSIVIQRLTVIVVKS